MIGERINKVRNERGYTLEELSEIVGKSIATLSRVENNPNYTIDLYLKEKIADALNVSVAYLENKEEYVVKEDEVDQNKKNTIAVEDDAMSPELPEGAIVRIRSLFPNEKLHVGSFYYIEFNNKRCFRMFVDDATTGLGFLPTDITEKRISYDREYVKVLGKAVAMKVVFEDVIEYE